MESLRDILNRHKWHTGDLDALELVVRHRGAPGDERVVRGADVTDVGASGVSVVEGFEGEPATFLPYHRLLAIRAPDGVVWSKTQDGGRVVFRCGVCGVQVSEPVEPVPEGWDPAQTELGEVGAGRYWRDPQGTVRLDPAVLRTEPGPWDDTARGGDGERSHRCPAGHVVAVEDGFPGLAWIAPDQAWGGHP